MSDETLREILELRRDGLMEENRRIEEQRRQLTDAIVNSPTFDPFGPLTAKDRQLQDLDQRQNVIIAQIVEIDSKLGRR